MTTLTYLIKGKALINEKDGKSTLPAVLAERMEIFSLLHENQRVGWNLFLENNKRACPFIREVRVKKRKVLYKTTSMN